MSQMDALTRRHHIGTRWHPQGVVTTTSKVVLVAIGIIVAAEMASADVGSRQSTLETMTGECTKVTLMDVLTDPAVCSDQVTAIRSGSGALGYAFSIDSQGNSKPWIISFSGANLRHASQNGGSNTFSVYKIYLTINGETDDLVGLGSCVLSNAYGDIPAKLSCSASTIKGSFAGEFVVRHIDNDLSPD
jgi:hypothetical protein